jgi:hypothetical protein
MKMMTLRFSLLELRGSEDDDDKGSSLFDCQTLKILGMLDPADCDTSLSLLALFDPEDDATR